MSKSKTYAAIGTAICAALLLLWMMGCHLTAGRLYPPPQPRAEIALAPEEEFVEVTDLPVAPDLSHNTEASAQLPENSDAESKPASESGQDVENQGEKGAPAPVAVQKHPSEIKAPVKEKKNNKKGPETDKKKQEQEKAKREANNQVSNAFKNAAGRHNTANGNGDKANAGKKDGKAPQGNLTGRGTGQAGGGWHIPQYASVPSPVTGSVKMTLTINRDGRVTEAVITGGDAPAATNPAVRQACLTEVRSRRFTRADAADAPETSRAYITYTFR